MQLFFYDFSLVYNLDISRSFFKKELFLKIGTAQKYAAKSQ
jgi:hypothetical protein